MRIISWINGVKFDRRVGRFTLDDKGRLRLIDDAHAIRELMTPKMLESMGSLTREQFQASSSVFVLEDQDDDWAEWHAFSAFNDLAGLFLTSLWLVCDNAAVAGPPWMETADKKGPVCGTDFHGGRFFLNARGKTTPVILSLDSLKESRELVHGWLQTLRFYGELEGASEREQRVAQDSLVHSAKGIPRMSRIWPMVEIAREQSDLSLRIAFYISCFETLFATQSNELTHKLCERIAFYAPRHRSERREVFRLAKKGYAVRSRVLHGGVFKHAEQLRLEALSVRLDELLRSILLKAIRETPEVFELEQAEFDDYFEGLILAGEADAASRSLGLRSPR